MPNERVQDHRSPVQRSAHESTPRRLPTPAFLGHTPASRQVQAALHRAVRSRDPVLLSGAPGTGKRAVAEILHHYYAVKAVGDAPSFEPTSLRRAELGELGQFVYVCPAESLTVDIQAKLLDAATERLVFGTHLDPGSDEASRRLHPRLLATAVQIALPNLRDRIEDLELLAMQILAETPSNRPIGGINDYALDCLRAYAWPGNLTELEEVLRHAVEVGSSEQIQVQDLPTPLRLHAVEADADTLDLQFSLAHAERAAIERAMRYARGNKRKAARLLQIGKTTLYRKLRCYDAEDDAGTLTEE